MSYPILVAIHLFGALIFVGAVFFEVLILEGARKHVDPKAMSAVERAIGVRARRLMPWVLLALYSAGIGLAWQYRAALADPFSSAFSAMLTIKIVLALSVLVHFIRAITWSIGGRMTARRFRVIHISVFCHVILIVLLAKSMFHVSW
jgi:hypothetical protein